MGRDGVRAITLCRVADVRYKTFVFKKRDFSAWRIRKAIVTTEAGYGAYEPIKPTKNIRQRGVRLRCLIFMEEGAPLVLQLIVLNYTK